MTLIVWLAASKDLSIEEGNLEMYTATGIIWKGTTSKLNIKIRGISKYSSNEWITWYFNPLAALHMGGIWERIKNSQKSHIQHDQNNSSDRLSIDDNILRYQNNCQQSTSYVSDKPNDLDLLTPNHLLLGRYNSGAVIE